MKGPAINYNGSVNLKRDHPLWEFALPLGTLTHGGTFVIKRLSRGGENIEEFYIFSALYWKKFAVLCSVWQIFMQYFCNYGLEFWYCGISKRAKVFVIGDFWHGFVEIVEFSLLCYGVRYTPSRSNLFFFFCVCVFSYYKTGFNSVISSPVEVVERFSL